MVENILPFLHDLKFAARSLLRANGLTATVILTLALGIGANTAMFSLVRGVLLRPLVNHDEDRLIYIRQSATGANNTTFSVPEIENLRSRVKTLNSFGEFSTIGFTMVGLGEPRSVQAGVVNGSYFQVMGLRPVLGRLLDEHDDGPNAAAATMATNRIHRMTELFGRLAPGADLQTARAELRSVYGAMKREHSEAYPAKADFRISAVKLRDQLTSGARTILLVLMASSVLVFVIACSNVANLILARTMRRENELGIRAALGAGTGALRRILLAESLLLCSAGATLGILIAGPMVAILARYLSRYSLRALDLTVDVSMLLVGAGLAVIAAALLAFVPRLPSSGGIQEFGLINGSARVTGTANRTLKIFAVVQIAASFVLVASAGATIKTLLSLELVQTGFDTHQVLAVDVPVMHDGRTPRQVVDYYGEAARRIRELPGVQNVAVGTTVPWRDAGSNFALEFSVDGHVPASGEERSHAEFRIISPGFFATLGLPMVEGRDFKRRIARAMSRSRL